MNSRTTSPLTQGRGLKPVIGHITMRELVSPLTQGRGLKHVAAVYDLMVKQSPLTQGRGLKQQQCADNRDHAGVAPHAGAWIETFMACSLVR